MKRADWAKFPIFWFPLILYSGIIFYASSVPNVTTPLPEIFFDKFLHVAFYLPFGFLLARSVDRTGFSGSRAKLLGIVFVGAFLYGVSDEIHQNFVPGRDMAFLDMVADTLGGFLGGHLYFYVLRIKEKRAIRE